MDWIKTYYERVILAVATVALLATAGWAALQVNSFPELFAERNSAKPPDNKIAKPDVSVLDRAAGVTEKPVSWSPREGSLLVSRPYVLKEGRLFDPLEGGEDLHPPIKNSWLIKYNLDYALPDVKDQDPDQDRFSNLEEFNAGTDPTNKESVPPYATKLRLVKFDPKPFRLKFSGSPDEGQTFTINTRDLGGRTQFLKLGDTIEGAPYKLLSYEPKKTVRNEIEVDVSELVIQNTETGQKITLVFDKEADDPTSFGEFVYLYDNSTFRVKKDDEFALKPEDSRKYKLIDISATGAQIQDTATGEKIPVARAE